MKFKLILVACILAFLFRGQIQTLLAPKPQASPEQAVIATPAPAPAPVAPMPAAVAATPAPRFFEEKNYSNPLDAAAAKVGGSPSPGQNSISAALQAAKQRIRNQANSSQ